MSAETKQVLEMLKEGKITTEDAERLLEKLSGGSVSPADSTPSGSTAGAPSAAGTTVRVVKRRFLRIQVERPGRDHVNMRVPLSLARAGKWLALIPPRVTERLAEQGIDLSSFVGLQDEQLAEALENTNIDIDKGNGKKVRIFCE
jgi:SHOCT-like domain